MNLKLYKIRQRFQDDVVADAGILLGAKLSELQDLSFKDKQIAIAVGSRGIDQLDKIVKTLVDYLHERGAKPFIFPAMGSHGGATAEGQAELLAGYGVTEEAMGCPVRSSMEVVELDAGDLKNKVFMDRFAYESDGIILVNRVKPHTDFHGDYESGLCKMLVLGVGKHRQALEMHKYGVTGLKALMPQTAEHILKTGKVVAGLALVEDPNDRIIFVEVIKGQNIMKMEKDLLVKAREFMPRLPVKDIDVLIVDELGKNISGTGMDTNIIGRMKIHGEPEPDYPDIKQIVIDGITDESHGNALGIGLADVATRNIVDKIDYQVMYENVFTSTFLERAKVPVTVDNMQEALKFALRACGPRDEGSERVIRIKNTLKIKELYVSDAILQELGETVDVLNEEVDLLDEAGNIKSW